MSILDRYKKTGGFIQLLTLLETCGAAKKEKFLKMIYEENQDWYDSLKSRIFTIETILNWPQDILSELTSRTQPITLAALAKGPFESEQINKLQHGLSYTQLAKVRDLSDNKTFSKSEINSSIEKFLGEVRVHIQHGVIKLEKFAPELAVPSDIEDILSKKGNANPLTSVKDLESASTTESSHINSPNTNLQNSNSQSSVHSQPHSHSHSKASLNLNQQGHLSVSSQSTQSSVNQEELMNLKKLNHQLQGELNSIRNENKILKEKLEKIRKIA